MFVSDLGDLNWKPAAGHFSELALDATVRAGGQVDVPLAPQRRQLAPAETANVGQEDDHAASLIDLLRRAQWTPPAQ